MTPRLVQVCNVGQICGGTAACAWTVTRALPGFVHDIVFLGPIAAETQTAFAPWTCHPWPRVTPELLRTLRPDAVLLHNTAAARVTGRLNVPTVAYVHSQTRVAVADITVYCSRWLTDRCGASRAGVLWQGVPCAPPAAVSCPGRPGCSLVIGRLCSPQARKWPAEQLGFYERLAARFPDVWWEFVGCPTELQARLKTACRGRTTFWNASWERRSLLTTWDVLLYHQPALPESFGRTVAEGMRVGCVPVVDRQGGFVEQLEAGGGLLCASPAEFATAIDRLHEADELRRLAEQARGIANAHWSLEVFAKRLLGVLDGCC